MAIAPTGDIFKTLEFDGESSKSYGVYITGEAVYNAPERQVEMITVPGRNGTLAIDQGRFENIEVTYPVGCFADNQSDFAAKVRDFRNELASRFGYKRLVDTYHPDEFRLGTYSAGLDVGAVGFHNAGEFAIVFDCKPQRFLTSGETVTTMTSSGTITNPTQFDAKPLIVVTGTGTLTVNGVAITISVSPTTIDCEAMEAYNGTTSRNSSITLTPNRFPVLSPGSNSITKTSGISQIKITPRWWRI